VEQQNNDLPAAIPEVPERSYFNFGNDVQLRLMSELSKTSFKGIAIRAPRGIQLDDHSELPVILFSRSTGLRDWEVSFERNSTIVAVDLLSGRIFQGHAFASPKKRDFANADLSMEGSRPDKTEAESISTGAEKLDVKVLLSLPWHPTRYAITVITHDWVSNTVIVELTSQSGRARRPLGYFSFERAVELNEMEKASSQRNILPRFSRMPQSPALKAPGVALSVLSQGGGPAVLSIYGAVKTAVPLSAIVEFPTLSGVGDREPARPAVVLTGALLIIQKDITQRPRIDVQIPVNTKQALEEGDLVEGFFGLNLSESLPRSSKLGAGFVYFFLGEHFAGPYEIYLSKQ
jgi:hypothetical protein